MTKPIVKLVGTDGNVFSIIGRVSKTLERNDQANKAAEFKAKAFCSKSYDDVLQLVYDYCEVE